MLRHLRPAQIERYVGVEVRRNGQVELGGDVLECRHGAIGVLHCIHVGSAPSEVRTADGANVKEETNEREGASATARWSHFFPQSECR